MNILMLEHKMNIKLEKCAWNEQWTKDLINEHVNGIWMLSIKHDVARDWDVNADGDQTIQGFAIPFSINKVIMLYFKVIKFSTTFFNHIFTRSN